ncbi:MULTISPECIES: T6SS immunity protein Tdi1 domain-containing protein [Streptomyces]|uniref:T6SS immunity protein Tdi1 domain-containing protein n=1 Tax=Streptomyces TaxID=1883 RepID=UPI00099C2995|nr:T6SS immunity protein Tdi1 domain-containing protein [Streptomyces virginiae]
MSFDKLSSAEFAERMPVDVAHGLANLQSGPRAGGFMHIVTPDLLDETLAEWLGGFDPSRTPFARTALGDVLYVRDLRGRARDLGLDAEAIDGAHDVSLIDVRYKQIRVLATSFDDFALDLADPEWLASVLRKDLYDGAVERLGCPDFSEIFSFVPPLALGGSEHPNNLERNNADVALSILRQL